MPYRRYRPPLNRRRPRYARYSRIISEHEPSRFFRHRFPHRPAIVLVPNAVSRGSARRPIFFRKFRGFRLTRTHSADRHFVALRPCDFALLRDRHPQTFAGFRFERRNRRTYVRRVRGFCRVNVFFPGVCRVGRRWEIASGIRRVGIGAKPLPHGKNRFLLLGNENPPGIPGGFFYQLFPFFPSSGCGMRLSKSGSHEKSSRSELGITLCVCACPSGLTNFSRSRWSSERARMFASSSSRSASESGTDPLEPLVPPGSELSVAGLPAFVQFHDFGGSFPSFSRSCPFSLSFSPALPHWPSHFPDDSAFSACSSFVFSPSFEPPSWASELFLLSPPLSRLFSSSFALWDFSS